jgi:hypothetical protein
VVVVLDGTGRIVQVAGRRTTTTTTTTPVQVRAVDTRVLHTALQLAGGDPSRLRFEDDGAVTVANGPRRA